ncbi:MAG: hypothetical protein ABJ013_05185 [Halioglobus sp.]
MTEHDFYSLGYASMQTLQTEEATFLTLLFGYLLAAHFMARQVSRIQLVIFNSIYVFLMTGLCFNLWLHWSATLYWFSEPGAPTPFDGGTNPEIHMTVQVLMHAAMFLGSLYFMWTVRRGKAD